MFVDKLCSIAIPVSELETFDSQKKKSQNFRMSFAQLFGPNTIKMVKIVKFKKFNWLNAELVESSGDLVSSHQ